MSRQEWLRRAKATITRPLTPEQIAALRAALPPVGGAK